MRKLLLFLSIWLGGHRIAGARTSRVTTLPGIRRAGMLLGTLLFWSLLTFAQTSLIQGTVTDDQGQPAAFASVQIKGTRRGANADQDGRFMIAAKPGDILVVSGTGFVTKEMTVGSGASVAITVSRKSTSMTEVVVTALGQTAAKAKVGY